MVSSGLPSVPSVPDFRTMKNSKHLTSVPSAFFSQHLWPGPDSEGQLFFLSSNIFYWKVMHCLHLFYFKLLCIYFCESTACDPMSWHLQTWIQVLTSQIYDFKSHLPSWNLTFLTPKRNGNHFQCLGLLYRSNEIIPIKNKELHIQWMV